MINQQTITEQIDQIRNFDLLAELKKLDVRNLDLDALDVFDIREAIEKIDFDALDVFDIRENFEKIDMPTLEVPNDLDHARAQLDEMRSTFESLVKSAFDTAVGFAPATRRDIDQLEERVVAAAAAAAAPKAAAKKKAPAKKKAAAAKKAS